MTENDQPFSFSLAASDETSTVELNLFKGETTRIIYPDIASLITQLNSEIKQHLMTLSASDIEDNLDQIGDKLNSFLPQLFHHHLNEKFTEEIVGPFYFETYLGLPATGKSTLIKNVIQILHDPGLFSRANEIAPHYIAAHEKRAMCKTGTGGINKDPDENYALLYSDFHNVISKLNNKEVNYWGPFTITNIMLYILHLLIDKDAKLIIGDVFPMGEDQSTLFEKVLQETYELFAKHDKTFEAYHHYFYINRLSPGENEQLIMEREKVTQLFYALSNIFKNFAHTQSQHLTEDELEHLIYTELLTELEESTPPDYDLVAKYLVDDLQITYQYGFKLRSGSGKRDDDAPYSFLLRYARYYQKLANLFDSHQEMYIISNNQTPRDAAWQVIDSYSEV